MVGVLGWFEGIGGEGGYWGEFWWVGGVVDCGREGGRGGVGLGGVLVDARGDGCGWDW